MDVIELEIPDQNIDVEGKGSLYLHLKVAVSSNLTNRMKIKPRNLKLSGT